MIDKYKPLNTTTMTTTANKNEAREIFDSIVERGLNFSGMTKKEFITGCMANWGCDRPTANLVAKMTGNW